MFTTNRNKKTRGGLRMGYAMMAMLLSVTTSAYAQPAATVTTSLEGIFTLIEEGDAVDLGDVTAGEEFVFLFQVQSTGDEPLQMSSLSANSLSGNVTFGDVGFTQVGQFFACSMEFTPNSAGPVEIGMQVGSNDPTSPRSFTVVAEAVAPKLAILNGLSLLSTQQPLVLDPVPVGQSTGAAVTIRNQGNDTLVVSGSSVFDNSGGDSLDLETSAINNVNPGAFAVMTIAFTPSTVGQRSFTVTVESNDPDSPYEFTVLAEGLEEEVEITDCNFNQTDDVDDIANGDSEDCNTNGVPDECETDSDNDGTIDNCDYCPGEDDNLDSDQDGTPDCLDNCPLIANTDQADVDSDGYGDACDNCPDDSNPNQTDVDSDGYGDVCDNCPQDANPEQLDSNDDGIGDACETFVALDDCNQNGTDDRDDITNGDSYDCNDNGTPDECEELNDEDDDGIADGCDNCPYTPNFSQTDSDGDGVGDACADLDVIDPNKKVDLGFCGAGAFGMMPMMMLGLCSMRRQRRHVNR